MKNATKFTFYLLLLSSFFINTTVFSQHQPTEPTTKQESRGRIWGYVFGDFFYKASGDTLDWGKYEYAATEKKTAGGRLRRLYFGYDYKISDNFRSHFLLEANEGTLTKESEFGLAIELGYLEWRNPFNLIPHSTLRGGLIPTPVFAFPEENWGYRSIEKEALDLRGFSQHVDQGVSLDIEFNERKSGGITVMVGNGTGKRPSVNKKLEYYASIYKKLLDEKLTLELMGNYKSSNDSTDRFIGRFFASYEVGQFRLGLEVSEAFNDEVVSGRVKEVVPLIVSFYTAFALPVEKHNLSAFLRYDYYNPDYHSKKGEIYPSVSEDYRENTLIAGFQYSIDKKVNIMPNLSVNTYAAKKEGIIPRKADVVPRITLYWLFGD